MHVALLALITGIVGLGITLAGPALAQPVQLEETAPATLPDLTPDVINKSVPGYVAPESAADAGESSMVSPEPEWSNPRRPDRKINADEIFAQLPYDVQNQILNETQDVNRECNNYNIYSQFHDCECLAGEFFEERVFSPEDHKDAIVGRISSDCVSVPGAAGYGYDQCLSAMRYVLKTDHTSEFCKCFALEFAKNYELSPYPDFDNIRAINGRTSTYCLKQSSSSPVKGLP